MGPRLAAWNLRRGKAHTQNPLSLSASPCCPQARICTGLPVPKRTHKASPPQMQTDTGGPHLPGCPKEACGPGRATRMRRPESAPFEGLRLGQCRPRCGFQDRGCKLPWGGLGKVTSVLRTHILET